MKSLLDGITPEHINTTPFPHVFISNAMDAATAQALGDGFPTFAQIAWSGGSRPPGNRRYQLSAWPIINHDELSATWKEFVDLHSSPAFFEQVVALFQEYWPDALKAALDGSLLGHSMGLLMRDRFENCRILQDARVEINTPIAEADGPSSSRGPHLDMPNRLFSCLYYLREEDDDAVGGDLELFRWTNGPTANIDKYALPADSVEVVATIPYRANQMVIFPQGINAVHGVSVRQPTPHTRRYVFISAEIADDWLKSPVTLS
ncbi:2OG-Fe(II) oxygenase [Azospirillum griseum]|uniref:2OG-Fe(II) oxygenase n=1 Tax=Azospirillum griseum TaxID=2496639 RepID=A0A3S0IBK3_9PROT|nr:2OG-Fe(II) oxygenase [Azospirillum griseum]RTR14180.1 2OG-Fe(II) oxygenase [Azospirillum griseum]